MSIVKSPYSDVDVPEVPLHVGLYMRFTEHDNKVALVDAVTGKQFTYKELMTITQNIASGLVKLGLKKGDVVSMYSYNTIDWVFMFWGVICAGGTVTTVNPSYTKFELTNHLKDSRAKFLYTVGDMLPISKQAYEQVSSVQKIICSNSNDDSCVDFTHLVNDDGSLWPELEQMEFNPKEDVAIILYSSGTTGVPKGVMITHYNIVANGAQYGHPDFIDQKKAESYSQGYQETIMAMLPMYHAYGLVGVTILGLAGGHKLIILPRFEPRLLLQSIQKYKVTYLPIVPPIVIFLAKSPLVQEYDLSSVFKVNSGGATLAKHVEQEVMKKMNISEMRQGFGMTETTVGIISFHPNTKNRPGSCGVLIPSCEAKIVDVSSGRLLGANERGELWLKGPQIMKGYLNNPKATRETIDKDGFLHTGDIAYYDQDGYFYIVDRIKELIKVKGLQVAPAELEALLLNHPKVADVGVVGIPDERSGELPKAYIVKKPGTFVTEKEIYDYVAERLAPFKHLKGGIQFISELPRLPSGKIVRRKLKEINSNSKM